MWLVHLLVHLLAHDAQPAAGVLALHTDADRVSRRHSSQGCCNTSDAPLELPALGARKEQGGDVHGAYFHALPLHPVEQPAQMPGGCASERCAAPMNTLLRPLPSCISTLVTGAWQLAATQLPVMLLQQAACGEMLLR